MPQLTDNIRPELTRLIPSALLSEVTCFVFYDNHPRDHKNIDVIVGTSNGEFKEFYKRELVNTLNLDGRYRPTDVKIIRNGNCDLFYLVVAGDELTIISRRQNPVIHSRLLNVERYGVEDSVCRGQAGLKVIIKDDAVPLVFDDNFVNLGDKAFAMNGLHADDSLPILMELKRKLTQTKFSVKCNEKTLNELKSLRQASALSSYKKVHPNTEESVFNVGSSKDDEILRVKCLTPWVKTCNKKLVIALIVSYTHSTVPIDDIHILLHGTNRPTMVYTTKLFVRIKSAPFWEEKNIQSLLTDDEVAVVSVIDLDEVSLNYLSNIEFNGVLSYKRSEKDHLIPFDHILLTSLDTMGEGFDALADVNIRDEMVSLAIVATTIKSNLILRHMRETNDKVLQVPDEFCKYLQMTVLPNSNNAVIYTQSPYHIINGVMIVFFEKTVVDDCYYISVYARSPSQVVALIHYIYDAMPYKIIITTPSLKMTPKSAKSSRYEEPPKTLTKVTYSNYASHVLNQCTTLLEYFDKCMSKMGESKNMEIRNKIGTEIDIFAAGVPKYIEFRNNIIQDALKGVKCLCVENQESNTSNAGLDMSVVME